MNLKDLNNLRADTEGRIKAVFLICMFVLVSAGGFAQNTKSISGTVREKGSNETVIGATVQVKGTHNGVITNENGEYTIKNVSPGQVLVFSMIGMNTVEKTVGSQNRIDVLMDAGVLIDEVVVTGYQTQRKVDLTGSVSSLSSDQFMQTNPLSLEQALKGKISGVQVMNNDGAPGGGITIKIRGASSITAGSSPLYVIDGFPLPISDDPLESPLATISPDAIESISILKDVSSTAIYGAQGANGVVLITTKKGSAGMSEISVKATYGISKLANSIPMLGAEDYMVKPFEMLELLVHIEKVLERTGRAKKVLTIQNIRVDVQSHQVYKDGIPVSLKPMEYDLFVLLLQNKNIALGREELLKRVWGENYLGESRTVDVHIGQLRKKLELYDEIRTIPKLGYRLEE